MALAQAMAEKSIHSITYQMKHIHEIQLKLVQGSGLITQPQGLEMALALAK